MVVVVDEDADATRLKQYSNENPYINQFFHKWFCLKVLASMSNKHD